MLSCNQIGFNGDAKKAPATKIRWFKDGKLIRNIPGKVDYLFQNVLLCTNSRDTSPRPDKNESYVA